MTNDLATIEQRVTDMARSMGRESRASLHADLLARVEQLDDEELALLQALELASDMDQVTRFPKANVIHRGAVGIEVGGTLYKELVVAVLAYQPRRGLWSEGEKVPVCASQNGLTPLEPVELRGGTSTGPTCAECPMNRWGSAAWWEGKDGDSGNSKACKEQRLLGLLLRDTDVPVLLFVPPTSIKAWEEHVAAMALQRKALAMTYTTIRAESTSSGGFDYAELRFAPGERVSADDARRLFQLKQGIQSTLAQTTVEAARDDVVGVAEDGQVVEGEVVDDAPPVGDAEAPPE